ncbi:Clavaminate synthase-like protein [Rhizodiscina lignyota]|uniref:Clavaminate synthase-like protein n=1 Tax=Rhizodiscina lignyota TaxID=1504668 RepID=A0A9P4M7I2_9PEZI|nr:Clavaminate synthase-like protein [Rhizodiscina lignyota]
MGEKTRYNNDRKIPKISLRDFDSRVDEITAEIVNAAENVGFFSITDHGISIEEIEDMFDNSQRFFALPSDVKATVPWSPNNVGWEFKSQVRPSTGAADQKESYQLQYGDNMKGIWISDEYLPGFKERSLQFMHRMQEVSDRLMLCIARGLGFPDDYFVKAHDITRPDSQNVCRLLHYFETPKTADGAVWHRAGAHADWSFLTVLFQREGQSGLEICPGREAVTEFGLGDEWTKVDLKAGEAICNIGDCLMSWSDDRFKSTFHRVKAPSEEGDFFGERYSIAYFNQPLKDVIIQGPKKKYPARTGDENNKVAMQRHFAALKAKLEEQKTEKALGAAPTVEATA